MTLGKLQLDGSLIHVVHFLGSQQHQCRDCFNVLVRTSKGILSLRDSVHRLWWPFCCTTTNWLSLCIRHNGGRSQNHVRTLLIKLCWDSVDVHIGNCCLSIDYLQYDDDIVVSVEYQVEAAVKKLLSLPHLPDSLILYGVSDILAYVVSKSLAGRVGSSIFWDKGHLIAIITLWPSSEWSTFRRDFRADTHNTRTNSICAGCLCIPELTASMLFCRKCSAGAFCPKCYDLDLDRCIRCPEDAAHRGIASNVFRMRKFWLS